MNSNKLIAIHSNPLQWPADFLDRISGQPILLPVPSFSQKQATHIK